MINMVIKRNGESVPYNRKKIADAVCAAFEATGEVSKPYCYTKSNIITAMAEEEIVKSGATEAISVEEIQNIVEECIMRAGFYKTAKAYILYRQNRGNLRSIKSGELDVKKQIDSFIGPVKDWRVKENSTVTCTLGGLILSNSGAITARYWLNEVYDPEIAEAHQSAAIHIHDLSMLSGYCAGWSLKQLLQEGIKGVEGRVTSAPAKHLSTLCNQMVNFLGIMQNEWAG